MNRKLISWMDYGLGASNAVLGFYHLQDGRVGSTVLSFLVAAFCIACGAATTRMK